MAAHALIAPLRFVADLALPPRCPGCGRLVEADHRFCAACWGQLAFLGPPWCAACHAPFEFDRGEGALCAKCVGAAPVLDGVRAAVAYGPLARTLVLRLKYSGRIGLAQTIARQLVRLMPGDAELIVPVPLDRRRIWSRGFNQAALIGRALSAATGIAIDPGALQRRASTLSMRGLGRRARRRAVAGAFTASPAARLAGKRIVLVDDVHTSGATAEACCKALKRAGASSVILLCWARVLDGEGAD